MTQPLAGADRWDSNLWLTAPPPLIFVSAQKPGDNPTTNGMNPNDDKYNPAEDENQGVITKLTQGQQANDGVSQVDYMNPVTNQGPEPVKEEVNPSDTEANGVNDDLLAEEAVENGEVDMDNE